VSENNRLHVDPDACECSLWARNLTLPSGHHERCLLNDKGVRDGVLRAIVDEVNRLRDLLSKAEKRAEVFERELDAWRADSAIEYSVEELDCTCMKRPMHEVLASNERIAAARSATDALRNQKENKP